MKRDWIHTGRRPSGLCGAALLVAARLHGFNCEMHDIVKVVHIGRDTIRKRLVEFESTPSSQLTINEFMNIDLEAEHDPPAFTNGRIKAKLQQLENEVGGMGNIEKEIGKISYAIDDELGTNNADTPSKKTSSNSKLKSAVNAKDVVGFPEIECDTDFQVAENFVHTENREILAAAGFGYMENPKILEVENVPAPPRVSIGPSPTAASLGLRQSVQESMASLPEEDKGKKEDGKLDLDGIDDDEIDKLLYSPHEVEIRQRMWMAEFGEFLKELEEKRDRRRQELEKKEKARPRVKKAKYVSRGEYYGDSRTAGEAIQKLVTRQKLSNKINYEALRKATEIDTSKINAKPIELHEVNPKKHVVFEEQVETPTKKLKLEESILDPIEYAPPLLLETVIEESHDITPAPEEEEDDDEEEEEEDEEHMSAHQLMHQAGLANGGYGGDPDDGYDYD